jgi:hypothetical protein
LAPVKHQPPGAFVITAPDGTRWLNTCNYAPAWLDLDLAEPVPPAPEPTQGSSNGGFEPQRRTKNETPARIDLDELRHALTAEIERLAGALLGEPNRALSSKRDLRFGNRGSVSVTIAGKKRGVWFDHEAGQGGWGLQLIMHALCFGFREALDWARSWLGHPAPLPTPKPNLRQPKDRQRRTLDYAARLIAESSPITGTPGERYLRAARGLGDLPLPSELRFHPAVWCKETQSKHPALLVPCYDGTRLARVQAVLLDPATADKAKVASPKLTFGQGASDVPASFAARVAGDWIILTEGPEDAVVLNATIGWQADAALSSGSLGKKHYPPGSNILLFGDNGSAGHKAAEKAAKAHRTRGSRVVVAYPPNGVKDANDPLCQGGPEAIRAAITAAIGPEPRRPNCDIGQVRTVLEAETAAWARGLGPKHLLNNAETSAGKGTIALQLLAQLAAERRAARNRFIRDWRYKNHGTPAWKGGKAADDAGLKLLRVLYVGDNHELVAQHVEKARGLGFLAAHDGGFDRPYEPADDFSPPRCTQKERLKQTRLAGEPARLAACGLDLNGPHCPDRASCWEWQAIGECQRAEFVGTVAERATASHLPRELRNFDFVLIDEPSDRVFRPEHSMVLDLLDDHLFDRHPLWDENDEEDTPATEATRRAYATVRGVIDGNPNGYWPKEAMAAAGCDGGFFARLVELTDRRSRKTGMTAATPDDERAALARQSFRNAVRKLCGFFRLASAIQAGEEGTGRIEIDGDAPRLAILRPRAKLHASLREARVMVIGARLELASVQRWLPEVQPMGVAEMIPHAPHQTVVHIHRPGMGKVALRNEKRQRWAQALVTLEGDTSRPDATGVSIYKEHEPLFAAMPGVLTGHPGAMAGRKDWEHCSTFLNFGSRFLSPPDAAAAGAAETGEPVPIKRPVMTKRGIAMRDGSSVIVDVPGYEHPAAATALRSVRDFDVMQGPFGRPRGPNRTAANPVLIIDVGSHEPRDVLVDVLITHASEYAPDRFVMMAATGLMVEHSHARHRLHPKIYEKPWTGQNDKRLEEGGFIATALRVLCPPWRNGPREALVIGRYWVTGHAHRDQGVLFVSTFRQLNEHVQAMRDRLGAVRFAFDREIWPAPTVEELTINLQSRVSPTFIVSSGAAPDAPAGAPPESTYRTDHPPDG